MEKNVFEMEPEEEGVVIRINGELRKHLAGMGIRVGKKLKLDTRQPMNGPLVVSMGEVTASLGRHMAKDIIVDVKK